MNNIELLPCPFCGGAVEYHPLSHHMNNFWNKNTIYCPSCDFMMEGSSTIHLVKRWNTRRPMEHILMRLEEEKSDWNYDYNVPISKAIDIVKEEGIIIE